MANKYRGEVALPMFGEGVFICFDLDDLAALEAMYGLQFFDKVEQVVHGQSPTEIRKILTIVLRERDKRKGEAVKIGPDCNFSIFHQEGGNLGDAAKPILDALAQSYIGKSYDDLIKEAEAARKEQLKRAVAQAKEVAAESDVPFEALLNALLLPQTG